MLRSLVPMVAALLCSPCLTGCDDDAAISDADAATSMPDAAGQSAVVCDWLNRRLDLVELSQLKSGASREDVLIRSLDLSGYEQGPLNVELTPDGRLALVSLSSGFFSIPLAGTLVGGATIPTGPGRLLFVDMESFEIVDELETGEGPMGIAITHDGATAFVAHFTSTFVTVVDIAERSVVEQVEIGIYSEEIALDESGSVGIFSYSSAGNVRTFGSEDFPGTVSEGLELSGDAAGVAFFPGTQKAYVVQAPMPLLGAMGGHTVVDASDPMSPVVLEDFRDPDAPVTYPAAAAPERDTVLVPGVVADAIVLDEIGLKDDDTAEVLQSFEVGTVSTIFGAYGATVVPDGRVLLSVPATKEVIVVDLDTQESYAVEWGGAEPGPVDIAWVP